jgi:hypothetical protein
MDGRLTGSYPAPRRDQTIAPAIGTAKKRLRENSASCSPIGTGTIFYLGFFVARFTGEDLLGRTRKNKFSDRLFLHTVFMAFLAYAIAIPFFLIEPTSLPLSVGILTGLMWVPFSGIIEHWVGIFHSVARTVLIVAAWYLFPQRRFVVIPAVIVGVYLITIYILTNRLRSLN